MAQVNLTIMWIDSRYSNVCSRHSHIYSIPVKSQKKKNLWDVGFHIKPNGFNLLTF